MSIGRKQIHSQIQFYSAALLAFTLPIAKMMQLFIIFLLLNWLIEGDFKNKFRTVYKNKFAMLLFAFYILHLIGLLYTQNMHSGLFDVQVKMTLLLLPLILVSRPLTSKQTNFVFTSLLIGALVSSLILLSRAIYCYFVFHEDDFFYEAFAVLLHPSYLSMYINVLIVWLLLGLFKIGKIRSNYRSPLIFLLLLYFGFINVLLSSKMGMICMCLIFLGFGIFYFIKTKKYLIGTISASVFIISVWASAVYIPAIEHRVSFAIAAISKKEIDIKSAESSEVRILIWKAANRIIADNFLFGVGTGDSKDALINEYKERGMTGAIDHNLNAHNEFYQVSVALGIIGLLLLVLVLGVPLYRSLKVRNAMYALFLLIISLNFLAESMFETQAGVLFFALFYSLLCFVTDDPAFSVKEGKVDMTA